MTQYIDGITQIYKNRKNDFEDKSWKQWEGFKDLCHFLTGSETLDELAQRSSRYIAELLDVDYSRIILLDISGGYYCVAKYPVPRIPQTGDRRKVSGLAEILYAGFLDQDNTARLINAQEQLLPNELAILEIDPADHSWILPLRVETQGIGVLIVGQKSGAERKTSIEDSYYLIDLVTDQLANAFHRTQLNEQLASVSIETVIALSKTLESRDLHSATHSKRMASLSEQVATCYEFSARETRELCWAALLHDIGKIGVADNILKKKGPLTRNEWKVMKKHPEIGARIVQGVSGLEKIAPLIMAHHERYDGKGYPGALKGKDIPLGARILSVIDAYSTMTEGRPYQSKRTHSDAILELKNNAGTAYDPDVVSVFTGLFAADLER